MDRKSLKEIKNELKEFIEAVNISNHALTYACLIPAYENERNSPLILQVYGEWMNTLPCSEAISIMVKYLFRHSSVETRKKIYRIDIYDEYGDCQCSSDEYILIGENPAIAC